jgi:hypothetical protein
VCAALSGNIGVYSHARRSATVCAVNAKLLGWACDVCLRILDLESDVSRLLMAAWSSPGLGGLHEGLGKVIEVCGSPDQERASLGRIMSEMGHDGRYPI